jgi:hypothetical protein
MEISKKAVRKHKKTCKTGPDKKDLEIVWEQVFPEDAEQRIQRAFEMLLNKRLKTPD